MLRKSAPNGVRAEYHVAADRFAACEIGAFLRFGISPGPNIGGVGQGRRDGG